MGTTTKNLGLYKPAANDYYNVEKDQNENFDKIDEKIGEVDNNLKTKLDKGSYEGDAQSLKDEIDGKEPAFSKKSGFNKEKTSEYKSGKDAEKLFTQEGAYNLNEELQQNINNKIGIVKTLDGINSPEELLGLAPGIYKLNNKNLFGIGVGWWTVTKYLPNSAGGDQIVKVNYSAGNNYFYQGGFSNGRWTGWHKFNACPYEVGDIYITSRKGNPAELWLGTAWEKIQGRFLYATSHDENAGVLMTGGNSTVTLTKDNLPNVKIQVEPFSLSRGSMNITGSLGSPTKEGVSVGTGAFKVIVDSNSGRAAAGGGGQVKWDFDASRSWTGTTSTASPYTQSLGNSTPIDIMPPYINVHMWRRTQ